VILEHWVGDDEHVVFPAGTVPADSPWLATPGVRPVKCCEIEGADYADCMRRYHEHMGWEPYRSEDAGPGGR